MAFVLQNPCLCQKFKFREKNGRIEEWETGKVKSGCLVLQNFSDRMTLRITLFDTVNVVKATMSRLLLPGILRGDVLMHFDFDPEEVRSGVKRFRIEERPREQSQENIYIIFCYDYSTHTGRMYAMEQKSDAIAWAEALGVKQIYRKENGVVTEIKDVK